MVTSENNAALHSSRSSPSILPKTIARFSVKYLVNFLKSATRPQAGPQGRHGSPYRWHSVLQVLDHHLSPTHPLRSLPLLFLPTLSPKPFPGFICAAICRECEPCPIRSTILAQAQAFLFQLKILQALISLVTNFTIVHTTLFTNVRAFALYFLFSSLMDGLTPSMFQGPTQQELRAPQPHHPHFQRWQVAATTSVSSLGLSTPITLTQPLHLMKRARNSYLPILLAIQIGPSSCP